MNKAVISQISTTFQIGVLYRTGHGPVFPEVSLQSLGDLQDHFEDRSLAPADKR